MDDVVIYCVDDIPVVPTDHNAPNLPAGATNLVQNGDFANNSVWALNNDAGSASIADGMAKLTVSGSTGIDQSINVEAGKTYVISFYTWVTSATNMKTAIQLNGAGLNWALNHSDGYNRVTDGWQENTYTINPTASGSLWFRIRCAWGGVGEFYVDDVVIYCVDDIVAAPSDHGGNTELPDGATELISDGGFATSSPANWSLNLGTTGSIADGMLKFTKEATGVQYVTTPNVPIQAGKTYVLSYYYWMTEAATKAYTRARVLTNPGTAVVQSSVNVIDTQTANTDGWVRVEKTFTVANDFNTTSYPNMQVWLYNCYVVPNDKSLVGTLYIDDVSLYCVDDLPAPPPTDPADHGGDPELPSNVTNIIENGDFANGQTGSFNWDTTTVVNNTLKHDVTGSAYWQMNAQVEGGETYVLSYYINVTAAASGFQFSNFIAGAGGVGRWMDFATAKITAVTNGWVRVTYSWQAAASGTVNIGFKNYGAGAGTYYVDDISLYQKVKTGNLLIDQGANALFDESALAGWNISGPNVTWDGTTGATNIGSLKLNHSEIAAGASNHNAYMNINPYLAVEANTNYKFKWSYKTTGTPIAKVYLALYNGNTQIGVKTIQLTNSTEWATDDWVLNTGSATSVRIDLNTEGGEDSRNFGILWFDDLSFTKTTEAAYTGLLNGDFENEKDLRFWALAGGEPTVSTAVKYSGEKSLKLDRTYYTPEMLASGRSECVRQTGIEVEPNGSYVITYYHKIVGGGQAYIKVYEYNAAGATINNTNYNITYSTGDVDWKKMAARFQVSAETTSIGIDFYNNELTGTVYIDAVSMEQVDTIVDTGLPKNGDFTYRDFNTWKFVSNQPTVRNNQTIVGQDTVAGDFDFHENEAGLSGIDGFSSQGFGRITSWGKMGYYNLNGNRTESGDYVGINSALNALTNATGAYEVSLHLRADAEARSRRVRVMISRYETKASGDVREMDGAYASVFDVKLADTDNWQNIKVWFDGNGAEFVTIAVLVFDGDGTATATVDVDCASLKKLKNEPIGANMDMQVGEIGSAPANWAKQGHTDGTLTTIASPSGEAGDLAAKLTYPTDNYASESVAYVVASSQLIPVKAGRVYEISYWGMVNGNARANGWVDISQFSDASQTKRVGGSPNGVYRQWARSNNGSVWQQVRFTLRTTTSFTDAAGGLLEDFYLRLDFAARGAAEFIFDNVQVRELTDDETKVNMDFENDYNQDNIPDGWYLSVGQDMEASLSIDTTRYHDGKQSMKIHSDSELQLSHLDSVAMFGVTEGEVYEFSFWMVSANGSPSANIQLRMYFYDERGDKLSSPAQNHVLVQGRQEVINAASTPDEWTKVYTRTVIPAGAKYASLQFYGSPLVGDIWVDDIFVGMVMDSESANLSDINIVAHNDFHALDEKGNIPEWMLVTKSGKATLSVENRPEDANYDKYDNAYSWFDETEQLQTEYYDDFGRLTVKSGESYMKYTTTAVSSNYQYQVIGRYRSEKTATLQVDFRNFNGTLVEGKSKQLTLTGTEGEWSDFKLDFIAPSCTYTDVLLGLEGAGVLDVDNLMILQTGLPITQGAWSGQWVWYNENYKESQQEYRYFRYEFDLVDEAEYAPIQVTADDKFEFYVNGTLMYSNMDASADTWSEVQIIYLAGGDLEGESPLRKGKNVFAFKVFNNVSECGLLYDGKWTLKNGAELEVVSDRALTMAYKTAQPKKADSVPTPDANGNDWTAIDYVMQTSSSVVTGKWSQCKSFGVPPCSPWGNIFYSSAIYSQNFITITNMVGDNATVNDGVFEFELTMILEKALTSNIPLKAAIWVKNSVNEVSSGAITPITNTDMTEWPTGKEFTVKFQMRVPNYLESGRYTLQWDDTYISIANEDIADNKFISFKLVNEIVEEETVVEMVTENGAPTIKVNGELVNYFAYSRPDHNHFSFEHEASMINSGIEVYTVRQGCLGKKSFDYCWPADGVIDYEAWDDPIYETLANNPDAYLCVQVGLQAPDWWFEEHPEDRVIVSNEDGTFKRYSNETNSFPATELNEAMGEVLRLLMEHMKGEAYYSRVIDIQVTCGTSFEGMYWGDSSLTYFPDFSESFIKGFQSWVAKKYGTVEKLQEAWGDDTITTFFDYQDYDWEATRGLSETERLEIACAEWGEHLKDVKVRPLSFTEQVAYMNESGNNGTFLNINRGKEQQIQDQNNYLMESITDAYLYWGEIIDEVHKGTRLISCYNGYLFAGAGAQDISAQHTDFARLLRSDLYDFFVSPASYSERNFGLSDTWMGAQDTVQAHGKMAVIEEDHRSSLVRTFGSSWDANDDNGVGATRTMEEFLKQLKKNTANAMVSGNGLWMFDMQGGWFDDDQFYQLAQEIQEEWDISQYLDKDLTSEVAYFIDEDTTTYFSRNFTSKSAQILSYNGYRIQRKELQRLGDTFDVYMISSLVDNVVPDHKINIIFSAYELSEAEKEAIDRNLKKDGKIVIWVYANGVSNGETNDIAMMSALTGIPLVLEERYGTQKVQVTTESTDKSSIGYMTNGLIGEVYGVESAVEPANQSPTIYGNAAAMDSSYEVLGILTDNGAPGLIAKDMGDWTSVYSAGVALPATLIRNLMEMVGAHSYTDDMSMNVISNGAYVMAHTVSEGEKVLTLTENRAVYDVYEHEFVSMDTDEIRYVNDTNGTKLYRLTTPNTYLVVARVRGGHGTISALGATEVAVGEGFKLTIKPDKGYEVASITVNGETVKSVNELNWKELDENKSILVKFKPIGKDEPTEKPPADKPTEDPPVEDKPVDDPVEPPVEDDEPTVEPETDAPAEEPELEEPVVQEPTIRVIREWLKELNWTAILGVANTAAVLLAGLGILLAFLIKRNKKNKEAVMNEKGEK